MKTDVPMTPKEFMNARFGIHQWAPPGRGARHLRVTNPLPIETKEVECHRPRDGNCCPGCSGDAPRYRCCSEFEKAKEEKE
jgi:hypothetical protein